jgi:hypothetical protein
MIVCSRIRSIIFRLLRSAPENTPRAIASTTAAPTKAKIVTPQRISATDSIRPPVLPGTESIPARDVVTTAR